MRIGKVLFAALVSALFLLLLSTLVVSTASEADAELPPQYPANLSVRFLPLALPAHDADNARTTQSQTRTMIIWMLLSVICAVPVLLKRDANGRVLCALRYENCVYQLFRQEIAGG